MRESSTCCITVALLYNEFRSIIRSGRVGIGDQKEGCPARMGSTAHQKQMVGKGERALRMMVEE
jgi:hypothetical protein